MEEVSDADRDIEFKEHLKKIMKENAELLERLAQS
jgi:hypothetical protein